MRTLQRKVEYNSMDIYFSEDPRRNARILVLQELYAGSFKDANANLTEMYDDVVFDEDKYNDIKTTIKQNQTAIDKLIVKHAKERPIEDINVIDMNILRIAIAEAYFGKLAPPKVAINEAVEIAKTYGSEASYRFVNGVLGALAKTEFPDIKEDGVQ